MSQSVKNVEEMIATMLKSHLLLATVCLPGIWTSVIETFLIFFRTFLNSVNIFSQTRNPY